MIRLVSTIYLLIILIAAMLIGIAARQAMGAGSLVNIFEARFGAPGTPHVVPECGCTMKYVGTKVDGRDFYVHFRQMD